MGEASIGARARAKTPTPDSIVAWEDGELLPLEKLDVHRRGLRHKAVSVFVNAENHTLLQRRALTKYHTPGLWSNACCTHPRWEESARACARRRLGEELNIAAGELVHRGRVVYRAPVGNDMIEHEEVDIFTLELPRRIEVAANPAEVSETRWVRFDDLEREVMTTPASFTPWLAIYLAQHRSLLNEAID
jgi:isopentenyl-diphosphate Delta-isomerase